jgi:meiotic recombination protein REC8
LVHKTKLIPKSYGVSRVYDQQCGYVLSDAQAAQIKMKDLFRVVKSNDIAASVAQARYVKYLVRDDFY